MIEVPRVGGFDHPGVEYRLLKRWKPNYEFHHRA